MTAIEPYSSMLLSEAEAERDRLRAINAKLLATLTMLKRHLRECRRENCPPDNYALAAVDAAVAKAKQATP